MLKPVFTLDYEIHGNGDGCPYELMVEPTARMLDQFDRYGAKLTIMADVAEILKFKDYRERIGRDDYYYDAISSQLKETIRRGHDVQLHLHASYLNAEYRDGRWEQDWSEYNFAGLPPERIEQIVSLGKTYLEELLQPERPEYRCVAFRAANWSVSPSRNVIRALRNNGIRIETSVFKYGRREGIVSFDYSTAPSNLVPWRVSESDVCCADEAGQVLEIPIYSELRRLGAFLTRNRIHRAMQTRSHRVANVARSSQPNVRHRGGWLDKLFLISRRHAWKADFNQCTGRQLIRAMLRAEREHAPGDTALPFVLIGHSKLFTQHNEHTLRPYLEYIQKHPERFQSANLSEFDPHFETQRLASLHAASPAQP